MQPEYIEDFTIDLDTAIKHKAMCIHQLLGSSYTQEELKKYCDLYGINTEQFLNLTKI